MFKQKYLMRQYFTVFTVNLSSICVGIGLGWFSPVLVKLMDPDEKVLSKTITEVDASLIVSTVYILGCFTNYPSAIAMDYFGRKSCITFAMTSKVVAELMMTFVTDLWMLVAGRALCGVLQGMLMCTNAAYSAEISSKEIRGSLISIINVCIAFGTLLMLSFGPYLSYTHLSIANTCVVAACTVPILFIPESPYFLYSKGRMEECEKVLTHFQGTEERVKKEIKQYSIEMSTTKVSSLEFLKNKTFHKSLLISIIISFLIQMIGQSIVLNYLQSILEISGTNLNSEMASVVVGVIQFISGILPAFMTDKVGRKPILITSLLGTAAGLAGLGAFFKLKEIGYAIADWMNYLPLISVATVLFCFSIGPGSLYLVIISEMYEGPARATGVSAAITVSCLSAFLLTKFFPYFTKTIGVPTSYWMLTVNTVLTCLFVAFFLPETKGKTFVEIQNDLKNRDKEDVSSSA